MVSTSYRIDRVGSRAIQVVEPGQLSDESQRRAAGSHSPSMTSPVRIGSVKSATASMESARTAGTASASPLRATNRDQSPCRSLPSSTRTWRMGCRSDRRCAPVDAIAAASSAATTRNGAEPGALRSRRGRGGGGKRRRWWDRSRIGPRRAGGQSRPGPKTQLTCGGFRRSTGVGDEGVEPPTPCASCRCSNQLS